MRLLGVPVTDAEARDLVARDALVGKGAEIADDVSAALGSSSVGNPWIDQAAGGVLHLQVLTPAAESSARRLAASMAPGAKLSIDRVSHSRVDIQAIVTSITQSMTSKSGIGPYATSIMTDDATNSVILTVAKGAPAGLISRVSDDWQGKGLRVVSSSGTWSPEARNKQSGPLYGGEYISSNFGYRCSVGYSKVRLNSNGTAVTLTAGHCGGGTWYQGLAGRQIGTTRATKYSPGGSGNCDCQAIGTIASDLVTNRVLTSDTGTYAYGNTASQSNYITGSRACLTGAAYGDNHGGGIACGSITAQGTITYRDAAYTLTDGVKTNIAGSAGGDSGGAYGSGPAFLGIHAGSFSDESGTIATVFSKSTNIPSIGVTLSY